jgi:hypothetical protein
MPEVDCHQAVRTVIIPPWSDLLYQEADRRAAPFATSGVDWNFEATKTLWELLVKYDLKFTVVASVLNIKTEDVKERYYHFGKVLLDLLLAGNTDEVNSVISLETPQPSCVNNTTTAGYSVALGLRDLHDRFKRAQFTAEAVRFHKGTSERVPVQKVLEAEEDCNLLLKIASKDSVESVDFSKLFHLVKDLWAGVTSNPLTENAVQLMFKVDKKILQNNCGGAVILCGTSSVPRPQAIGRKQSQKKASSVSGIRADG